MLRAALFGCGMIGAGSGEPHPDLGVMTHAGAYAACPDTELVAVCDADGGRARACADRFGGRPYTDPVALLAEQAPELVSVATPDATHAGLIDACLRAGVRAVLAEKPLALSVAEASVLVTWTGRKGLYLEDLFVRPEYRKRGIGRALLEHLAGIARTRG